MSTRTHLWLAAVAVLALGALGAPRARADFESDFNTAGALNFAVLYEGNGSHTLTINTNSNVQQYSVNGNVGLGDPNGSTPQL